MLLLSQRSKRYFQQLGLVSCLSLVVAQQAWATEPPKVQIPLDELRNFAEVYEQIKQSYVYPVEDKQLLTDAIKGMLAGLDPHSAYLASEDFQDLRESSDGEFGGLGIEISSEDGYIKIISPLDDGPAATAGLQAQDLILFIGKRSTRNLPVSKAAEFMRGEPGTKVELTIQRGQGQPFTVQLERAMIKIASVKEELLADNLGYVRLSQFQINTGAQLVKALEKLEQNNKAPLQGLILDLRNNPGGVLQAAADVADAFLDGGLIVYTQGRLDENQMRFDANAGDLLNGAPVIVLINGGSASASEIVAGALQDHKRALILGTPSFGKGSVQTVLPLSKDSGIKITTALYFTPLERSIQAEGIQPDILVQQASIRPVDELSFIKESDLDGHLNANNQVKPVSKGLTRKTEDYQLNEALNLLKALSVFAKTTAK